MARKKIMVVCDYFLPGFKGGGGTHSMVNLVSRFCDRYDFFVVTRNHDGRSDLRPYPDVVTGAWNIGIGGANVYYLPQDSVNAAKIGGLVGEVQPDAIFLNSVFSTPCISLLRARKGGNFADTPVILAPCGELTKASLAKKKLKKRLFLTAARATRLHQGVIWKATTDIEVQEIFDAVGKNSKVKTAHDLPPKSILPDFDLQAKPEKKPGSVKFACVARIVAIKNIHYFIENLAGVSGNVTLDVIGPIEDPAYWAECLQAAGRLPENISVRHIGAMSNDAVLSHLLNMHFFVLPSLSENFGYVFLEAMAAGCPLLISDRTIWNDIESAGAGWPVSLDQSDLWRSRIAQCVDMGDEQYREMSISARRYAERWLSDPSVEAAAADVFESVLGRS